MQYCEATFHNSHLDKFCLWFILNKENRPFPYHVNHGPPEGCLKWCSAITIHKNINAGEIGSVNLLLFTCSD